MAALPDAEIVERLGAIPGWEYKDNAIHKQFKFTEFMDGIRFINRIAQYAEATDHHPDITIDYTRITFRCTTHSEHGVTEKDFRLAGEIERTFRSEG